MIGKDTLHVIHPCAAGIDVHKMQVTATVRIDRRVRAFQRMGQPVISVDTKKK